MSDSLSQGQVQSTTSHLRVTPEIPTDNDHTRARIEPENTSGQSRSNHTSNLGSTTNGRVTNPRHRLHEFHSLLEAAQRIANSASFDTEGHRWREDDQPEPIIHLNRPRYGSSAQRLASLRRTYRGRPHVPGEDSGSEEEDSEGRMDTNNDSPREHRDAETSWLSSHHRTPVVTENYMEIRLQHPPHLTENDGAQPRSDPSRTRDRQPEAEEEQVLLEEALARSRAARSRFEADNQRMRYSTTGAMPTSQSFYDWAPEPSNTSDPAPSIFRSRPRALSGSSAAGRRWRPAERLQDYASSHARRDSGNNLSMFHGPTTETSLTGADDSSDVTLNRAAETTLGSHEDVVDRVERALQQYRIARRALRPLNVDVAFEVVRQAENASPTTGSELRARAGANVRMYDDRPNVAQNMSDNRHASSDIDARTEPSGTTPANQTSPTLVSRAISAGLQRREDPLRQRIREQIRERRRRGAQQALESSAAGREPPLARGPLFEGTPAPQFSVPSDARRMIEQVRQSHLRESSAEFKRAKGALQYLARLRDPEVTEVEAWKTAHQFGLHHNNLEETIGEQIPLSLDVLPRLAYSSWLESGMTWTGIQDANDSTEKTMRLSESTIDAITARNRQDRAIHTTQQHESFRSRIGLARDPLERVIYGSSTTDPVSEDADSVQLLEEAERSGGLTSMLRRSQELLRENDRQLRENDRRITLLDEAVRRRAEGRQRQQAAHNLLSTRARTVPDSDRWNVKVSLHSFDEKHMTVSGTMTASHKLSHPSYITAGDISETAGDVCSSEGSMDSFFTGEIIDFVHHGFDTLPSSSRSQTSSNQSSSRDGRQQDEWKVGGAETDLIYWAGIGPFKREIALAIRAKEKQNDIDRGMNVESREHIDKRGSTVGASDKQRSSSTSAQEDLLVTPLTEEEEYATKMDTMVSLLCNTRWLNNNIGANGWILMRWKERCFVAPGTQPNPDVHRPWISRNSSYLPNTADNISASSWNVNDLITNHRLRRRRERDSRVWSTNAAERDEFATSATTSTVGVSGERGPAWGLTISGFYYVALERQTGQIEAHYFDPGSTPFQRLKMTPDRRRDVGTNKREEDVEEKVDLSDIIGVKSGFEIIEFR